MGDQRLVTCTAGSGHPGQFRLVLGKCFVGALARTLSPQQVRSETVNRISGGRRAEIQTLREEVGGNGRRVRRQHREAQQKRLQLHDDLVISTVNMQGANWALCEARHVAKFKCLVDLMHEKHMSDVVNL